MPDDSAPRTISQLRGNAEKNRRLLTMNKTGHDFWRDWQVLAEESYKFVDGTGHWTDAEKEYLLSRKRTPIVINKILAPLMYVSGIQRANRQEPRLTPTEVTDANATAIMQSLLRWAEDASQAQQVDAQVFLDKLICGLGWWEYSVDFDKRLEGDPKVKRLRPFNVRADPNMVTDGWDNCQWVFHDQWTSVDDAMVEFPDFKDTLLAFGSGSEAAVATLSNIFEDGWNIGDPLADIRSFWEPETHRVKLQTCWYKTRVPRQVLIQRDDQWGDIRTLVLSDEQAAIFRELVPTLPPAERAKLGLTRRSVTQVRRAQMIGGILMEDEVSPFTRQEFPIFPAVGYVFDKYPYGLVEYQKWPQREKNARRSKMAEVVSKSVVTGFFNRKAGGANPADIDNFARGVATQIPYESEAPREIKMRDIPEALVRLDQTADFDVGSVIGIDLAAATRGTESGGTSVTSRHLDDFLRVGLTAQGPLFDSFQAEKAAGIRFQIDLLKQFVGGSRAMRILGARVSAGQETEQPITDLLTGGTVEDLQQMYTDAFSTEYDVTVDFKPAASTQKGGLFKVLLQLMTEVGFPVPPDVLTDVLVESGMLSPSLGDRIKSSIQQQQQTAATQSLGGAAVTQQQPQAAGPQGPVADPNNIPPELLAALEAQAGGGEAPPVQ